MNALERLMDEIHGPSEIVMHAEKTATTDQVYSLRSAIHRARAAGISWAAIWAAIVQFLGTLNWAAIIQAIIALIPLLEPKPAA